MERVVITGMGVVSPIGNDVESFWNNMIAGNSGITEIDTFDTTDFKVKIAESVKNFDAEKVIGKKAARNLDRFVQFALAAADQAWNDSKLGESDLCRERLAVYVGSGVGGIETLIDGVHALHQKGPRRVSPSLVPSMMSNAAAAQISIKWQAMGPSMSPVSACAIGNTAIGEAYRLIRMGEADAAFTELSIASFGNATALSTRNESPAEASRPFDATRDGFVMSEGAGILILESLSHAKQRGASIYAEVVGYGASSDAYHIVATHPEGQGAYLAMKRAVQQAGIETNDIDVISAHATSTIVGDQSETRAIKKLFAEHANILPVTANKSMLGHMLGAAGGAEAIALAKCLQEGIIPPTINLEVDDPTCDLDYVAGGARSLEMQYGLSNSFGFGGHNAAIVLKKYMD